MNYYSIEETEIVSIVGLTLVLADRWNYRIKSEINEFTEGIILVEYINRSHRSINNTEVLWRYNNIDLDENFEFWTWDKLDESQGDNAIIKEAISDYLGLNRNK